MIKLLAPIYILHWRVYEFYTNWEEDLSSFWTSILVSEVMCILNFFSLSAIIELYWKYDLLLAILPLEKENHQLWLMIYSAILPPLIWVVMYAGRDRHKIFEELAESIQYPQVAKWMVRMYIIGSILVFFYSMYVKDTVS